MMALRWQLRYVAGLLGWQGIVGLLLACAAVALYFAAIDPARTQAARLQRESVTVKEFARTRVEAERAAPTSESWLQHFYSLLPAKAGAPEVLRVIFASAKAQSLTLDQGEYKVKVDKNGRLLAYEIGLPLRGNYVQIRKFIADVLEQIPALALDEIAIKREAIGDPRIEAAVRFTLFLNGS
jgi:Tfp pilus assembly protein PilO